MKSKLNFERIQKKKDDTHAECISEITDFEERGYIIIKKIKLKSTLGQATW